MKEPILEPLLRNMRLKRVLPYIIQYPNCELLDIGCGWEGKLLIEVEPFIAKGIGVDFKAPTLRTAKIETLSIFLGKSLPFLDQSFDVVTLLAVLEHLDSSAEAIVQDIARVLKPGGIILVTAPTHRAKPILEFLAYKVGIVNPDEIADHKRYFSRSELFAFFENIDGLSVQKHEYFQLGMNNFLLAKKRVS